MTLIEFYEKTGSNYNDVLGRIPSEALIKRFLKMLPRDTSMQLLTDSVASNDVATAFRAVHTIKGVALNLSLSSLSGVCSEMTEALRGKSEMPENISELYEKVPKEHTRVVNAIDQVD